MRNCHLTVSTHNLAYTSNNSCLHLRCGLLPASDQFSSIMQISSESIKAQLCIDMLGLSSTDDWLADASGRPGRSGRMYLPEVERTGQHSGSGVQAP